MLKKFSSNFQKLITGSPSHSAAIRFAKTPIQVRPSLPKLRRANFQQACAEALVIQALMAGWQSVWRDAIRMDAGE